MIASHNKVLEQREQEIIRASSEEDQDDIGETRIFQKPTHKSSKKSKVGKIHFTKITFKSPYKAFLELELDKFNNDLKVFLF